MHCPYCQNSETSVIDTRPIQQEPGIMRRRKCSNCDKRFTTRERIVWDFPQVKKKDGRKENFDRKKIVMGVVNAVKKRPVTDEQVENLINQLEPLFARYKGEEIDSQAIGKLVLKKLFVLDQVAAVRFASVYLLFDDLSSFNELIKTLDTIPTRTTLKQQYPLMDDFDQDEL